LKRCKHIVPLASIRLIVKPFLLSFSMTEVIKSKMKKYGVKAVPTTVIDGEIKVVGIPDFPWICGDGLYSKLRRDYHM
jgi:hypothetical protein